MKQAPPWKQMAPEILEGQNLGMRPMQLMLAGLGSCSAIDLILFLRKMRQELRDIKLTVTAEREEDKVPSLFTKIHVHYDLYGPIDERKATKAMELSLEKYCSVAKLLEKTAEISGDFTIHP